MRALIIKSGGYLDKRLIRVLNNNNINGDIETKLTRNMINVYDCVIFSHQNDIPNLPKVIEQIVLEKKILVLYVNNTSSMSYFYNVIDDVYFSDVNEMYLDIELPVILKNSQKYMKYFKSMQRKNDTYKNELETLKLTNKAKRILMSKGLSEENSHQFIQRKSMDMRMSKKEFVNLIIENKIDI